MNEPKDGLEIVATPSSGWCDPETGTCYIGTADDATTVEASEERRRVSRPTR